MLGAEHPPGKRIFRQSAMAKDILVWHLNTVGPLCPDFLDGSSYVHSAGVLQPRYANVQRAKCTWKRARSQYIDSAHLNFYASRKRPPSFTGRALNCNLETNTRSIHDIYICVIYLSFRYQRCSAQLEVVLGDVQPMCLLC